MKTANTSRKNFARCAAGALASIGIFAAAFSGIASQAMAADIGKKEQVPTQYPAAAASSQLPEGYQKGNYKAVSDPLVENVPTAKDLTREEAAELGAQMLYEIFGVKLDNATIYLSYYPGDEMFPRATWCGDVRFGERNPQNPGYGFSIDAVTGERYSATSGRILSVDVPLGMDSALQKDPSEYLKLATAAAKEHKLVNGEVKEATLNCQGYSDNDPDITINVVGADGGTALVTFSRYDKALKGMSFSSYNTVYQTNYEKWLEEVTKKIDQYRAENKNSGGNESGLMTVPLD